MTGRVMFVVFWLGVVVFSLSCWYGLWAVLA